MAAEIEWYHDHRNLAQFAEVLDESGEFGDNDELFYFLQKPWKWNEDYAKWQEVGSPMPDSKNWDKWLNSLSEEEG